MKPSATGFAKITLAVNIKTPSVTSFAKRTVRMLQEVFLIHLVEMRRIELLSETSSSGTISGCSRRMNYSYSRVAHRRASVPVAS